MKIIRVTALSILASGFALHGSVVLFGVNGGLASAVAPPNGDLVLVDQTTGAVTPLGNSGFPRLTGLAIEPNGDIFATTIGGIPFPPGPGQHSTSDLLHFSSTGAVISDIGTVQTATGSHVAIADLAVQPGTGTVFAISNEFGDVPPGGLYTIDPMSGIATLIGSTPEFFGSIAFAPNGTLYLVGASFAQGPVNPVLERLNPTTAAVIGAPVPLADFYGALGIRPTDAALFVSNGMGAQIFTLNPTTGVATALTSTTGANLVADLDFVTPEPATFLLAGLALLVGTGLLPGTRRAMRARS